MPTPVSSARQCLASDAAAALDEAVAAAHRRSHAQTTSIHVVSALLSSSSSSSLLRDALSRARSAAYSSRLQFKALELCFGVSLDRLPSTSSSQQSQTLLSCEPPVSNSLMAAIKRSQANQRRNPDAFPLYHHQQAFSSSSSSSFSGVKVELHQLLLSILDDPVVSRVFGDAGFRNCDIKIALLRPPPSLLRFQRCPPLFLWNLSAGDGFDTLYPRGFAFPFPRQLCSDGEDQNYRRIREVLTSSSTRNPILLGIGAGEAGRDFSSAVERQNWSALPPEIRGVKFVSIEREISDLTQTKWIIGKLEEKLDRRAEGPGVVVSVGDLKELVDGGGRCDDATSFVVLELSRLLELHCRRLWVMGWSATYETYIKLL